MKIQSLFLLFLLLLPSACTKQGPIAQRREGNQPVTLGYLQLKKAYADAAENEGGIKAIKKVLDHKHSNTGKTYPCWNALAPFRGKDLPVSLKLMDSGDSKSEIFLNMAQLSATQFDDLGKDGFFSTLRPSDQKGFVTWKIEKKYKKLSQNVLPKSAIGFVDISGSMAAKKKLKTLRGIHESNVQFKKLYVFSDKASLKTVNLEQLNAIAPAGKTALYDNLAKVVQENPNENIFVLTDGRDNMSKMKLPELLTQLQSSKNRIDVVLTGGNADQKFTQVAVETTGQILQDIHETGEVLEPYLDMEVEKKEP